MESRSWKVLISLLVGSSALGRIGLAEENLLKNSGFEKFIVEDIEQLNENKKIFDWQINPSTGPGSLELVTDKEKAHSGSQCLIFQPKTPRKETHLVQMVPVKSDKKYVFKVWARADKEVLDKLTHPARIKLSVYQYKNSNFLGGVSSGYLAPVTETWQEFTYEYIPSREDVNNVGCAICVVDCPLYIDDVSFTLKEE